MDLVISDVTLAPRDRLRADGDVDPIGPRYGILDPMADARVNGREILTRGGSRIGRAAVAGRA